MTINRNQGRSMDFKNHIKDNSQKKTLHKKTIQIDENPIHSQESKQQQQQQQQTQTIAPGSGET